MASKKRLTQEQEFQIMKLVLDKFLWLGMVAIGYGIYRAVIAEFIWQGITWVVAGIVILVLFAILIIREYEILK